MQLLHGSVLVKYNLEDYNLRTL